MRWAVVPIVLVLGIAFARASPPRRLGGRAVRVVTEGRDLEVDDRVTGDALLEVRLRSVYDPSDTHHAVWKDLDGDGDPELILVPRGATASERVFQVRYGQFVEVPRAVARCGRAAGDQVELGGEATSDQRSAAIARLIDAVELHESDDAIVCDAGDAFAVAGVRTPARAGTIAVAPFAASCPGIDWAERHGRARPARRLGVYVDTDGVLERFVADADQLTVAAATIGDAELVDEIQPWVLDEHLFVIGRVHEEGHEPVHHVLVYDPVSDKIVAWGRAIGNGPVEVSIDGDHVRVPAAGWDQLATTAWQP